MMTARTGIQSLPIRSSSLRERVRHTLYEALRTRRFKPGERIVELKLAREMGVSQSVVREALRELEQMGLVESFPHRGTYVRQLTRDDAWEIYTMRATLERYAIRLALHHLPVETFARLEEFIDDMTRAAQAHDEQHIVDCDVNFHRTIVAAANHRLLLQVWTGINPLNWTFTIHARLVNDDPVRLAQSHQLVLASLRSGELHRAQQCIEQHIMELADQALDTVTDA